MYRKGDSTKGWDYTDQTFECNKLILLEVETFWDIYNGIGKSLLLLFLLAAIIVISRNIFERQYGNWILEEHVSVNFRSKYFPCIFVELFHMFFMKL